ncbi:unnamed protein product [Larinioides sclopetarius]|uniref:Cuticle protein 16.8 n=1 Tax=Larinioides sclopetarius TaxID=280406 RepID=A0AAV1ZTI0_9ARAC
MTRELRIKYHFRKREIRSRRLGCGIPNQSGISPYSKICKRLDIKRCWKLPRLQSQSTAKSIMLSQACIFAFVLGVVIAQHPLVHHVPVHHVEHHAPQPYAFGYSVKDHHGEQHRQEAGDGQAVKGSYGFTDDRGVHRQVNYVADHAGFRAQVKTNEPGTANQNPAAVHMISDAPYAHGHHGHGHHGIVPVVDAVVIPTHHGHHAHHGYGYAAPYATYGYAGAPYGGGYGYGLANGLLGGLGYYRYGY